MIESPPHEPLFLFAHTTSTLILSTVAVTKRLHVDVRHYGLYTPHLSGMNTELRARLRMFNGAKPAMHFFLEREPDFHTLVDTTFSLRSLKALGGWVSMDSDLLCIVHQASGKTYGIL